MFRVTANIDGAIKALDLFTESIEDVDGLLRDFSRLKKHEVNARFEAGGPGWAPLAQSTLAKREQVAASAEASSLSRAQRKMRTKLQKEYRRALRNGDMQAISRRLFVKTEFERIVAGGAAGYSLLAPVTDEDRRVQKERNALARELRIAKKSGNKARADSIAQRLDNFDKAHERSLGIVADDRLRKSLLKLPERIARAEKRYADKPLGKIAGSIVAKVRDGVLTIESRIPWAGVHNEGGTAGHGAREPERRFLEWTAEDFTDFVAMAQDRHLAAFEDG